MPLRAGGCWASHTAWDLHESCQRRAACTAWRLHILHAVHTAFAADFSASMPRCSTLLRTRGARPEEAVETSIQSRANQSTPFRGGQLEQWQHADERTVQLRRRIQTNDRRRLPGRQGWNITMWQPKAQCRPLARASCCPGRWMGAASPKERAQIPPKPGKGRHDCMPQSAQGVR